MTAASLRVRPWLGLWVVLLGTVLGTWNNGVANVALTDVLAEYDVPVSSGAWFVTSYILALAVALPVAGRLIDIHGSRRVSLLAMVGFLAASCLLLVAPSYEWVVAGRFAQGAFNAPVLPTIMVTVVAAFGPSERGRAMGTWVAVNGASFALSPVLAGWLTDAGSWRSVFWVNVAMTVLALIASVVLLPDVAPDGHARRIDGLGAALLVAGLVAVTISLSQATSWGYLSVPTLGSVAAGTLMLVVAVRRFLRSSDPLIDVRVLMARAYALPASIAGIQVLVLFGTLLVLPLMLVHHLGFSLTVAGLLVFILPATWALLSPTIGHAADRFGRGRVLLAGSGLLTIGSALLAASAAGRAAILAIVGMVAIGLGVAAIQATAAVAVSETVGRSGRGASTGVFHTIRFLAGAVGATLFAVVLQVVAGTGDIEAAPENQLGEAFLAVLVVAAALSLGALVLSRSALPHVDAPARDPVS